MSCRGRLQSALNGFLGTYTSRYTSWNGYWMFGFLISDLHRLEFDLLSPPTTNETTVIEFATNLAKKRLQEQLAKNQVNAKLSMATLVMEREPVQQLVLLDQQKRFGYPLLLRVVASIEHNRVIDSTVQLCVSPHDPCRERCNRPN